MYMFRLTDDQFVGLFLRAEHGFVDLYIFPERPIIESQRQWGVLDQGLLIKCYAVYRAILIQSLIFPFGEANRTLLFAYKE